ncbi:oxidoreductase [Ammoniphilus oxalaticus]|uniref:Oxidoreductase n=1 Tax=Ammoniphilus oxalaticus TaxID=66863 RepID=A0A419SQJ4_9BACL|nr:NAD(P)-dependent oxidoreductase [Ammoniphilus oxalaticus]RKD26774.1 oxidoreductase [Ammoniphilus oxalaticus]
MDKSTTTIGFIGLGVMGQSMAGHLIDGGYSLVVYNRTKEKANALLEKGAKWADTVADVAKQANVIITIVGYPKDVEEVYLGAEGLIPNAKEGTYFIDMTTSSPSLAARIYDEAKSRGMHSLDAPVSGGDIGAREARLSIMVGGDQAAFDAVKPIFELMGQNIVLQGAAGAGQHTKQCNQIALASTLMGAVESMIYAKKAGLDPIRVLESIETGAAGSWQLSNLAPKMTSGDFDPGFYIKHFIKDMVIGLEAAKEMGAELPGLELMKANNDKLAEMGHEDLGTQALYKLYDK